MAVLQSILCHRTSYPILEIYLYDKILVYCSDSGFNKTVNLVMPSNKYLNSLNLDFDIKYVPATTYLLLGLLILLLSSSLCDVVIILKEIQLASCIYLLFRQWRLYKH